MKDPKKVAMGKKSRACGTRFELKVRHNLEERGWIVDKWSNNVEEYDPEPELHGKPILKHFRLCQAKRKFNPFRKVLGIGTGFPDFIAFKTNKRGIIELMAVESKMDGKLDKLEKNKCAWLLDNGVFHHIFIAQKSEKRGKVKYVEFK